MTLRNSKEFPIKEASEWAGFSKPRLIFHMDYLQSAYQFSSVDYIILDSDVQPQNQQSCVGSNKLHICRRILPMQSKHVAKNVFSRRTTALAKRLRDATFCASENLVGREHCYISVLKECFPDMNCIFPDAIQRWEINVHKDDAIMTLGIMKTQFPTFICVDECS